jgi:transposase
MYEGIIARNSTKTAESRLRVRGYRVNETSANLGAIQWDFRNPRGPASRTKRQRQHLNRPGFAGDSIPWEDWDMANRGRYSQEFRERAVRMVVEHGSDYDSEWEAICSIAEKIGCSSESLRKWLRQTEVDSGRRGGLTSDEQARVKDLEREVRELRRANEILRKASAYFAQAELDRRPK